MNIALLASVVDDGGRAGRREATGEDPATLRLEPVVERVLAAALEDEVAAYIAAYAGRDENGRRLVVRNGHARPRQVTTAAGGGGGDRAAIRAWMPQISWRTSVAPHPAQDKRTLSERCPMW